MAIRTAPDPSLVAANKVITTLHLIGASGDIFTDSIVTTHTPTPAEMEAWAAAYQAATQASLYKISQSLFWEGDADPDNADIGQRSSVAKGVNLLYKNLTTLNSTSSRLVAPVAACMQGNQNIPLLSAAEFTALINAELAILTGYSLQHAQFTGRRKRTSRIKKS